MIESVLFFLASYRRSIVQCGMKKPQATSLRLSSEAKRLLRALAEKSGISMTAKLEVMIREHARREGVK